MSLALPATSGYTQPVFGILLAPQMALHASEKAYRLLPKDCPLLTAVCCRLGCSEAKHWHRNPQLAGLNPGRGVHKLTENYETFSEFACHFLEGRNHSTTAEQPTSWKDASNFMIANGGARPVPGADEPIKYRRKCNVTAHVIFFLQCLSFTPDKRIKCAMIFWL